MNTKYRTVALTIAGSDSGGGAGIQQDIRVFTALGVYASAVITALTAQNSLGVHAVEPVNSRFVAKQLRVVMEDIRPGFIKTGMLVGADTVRAVHEVLRRYPDIRLVIDTVMLSKNGTVLMDDAGVEAMRELLFPIATLITPNIPEAEKLLNTKIRTVDEMKEAAGLLRRTAGDSPAVLLKGGHMAGPETIDCLCTAEGCELFPAKRIKTHHTHGTGCTLSSAITALLSSGLSIRDACAEAIRLTRIAIDRAFAIGSGAGPLNVFAWAGTRVQGHGINVP